MFPLRIYEPSMIVGGINAFLDGFPSDKDLPRRIFEIFQKYKGFSSQDDKTYVISLLQTLRQKGDFNIREIDDFLSFIKVSIPSTETSSEIRVQKDKLLQFLKSAPYHQTQEIAKYYCHDFEIIHLCVSRFGMLFEFAGPLLKTKHLALTAVKSTGLALKVLGPLKSDHEIVLQAVKKDGIALYFADAKMQADKKIALAAVNQKGRAIIYVSEALKEDLDVAIAAIVQDYRNLEHLSLVMRNNWKIMYLACIFCESKALKYAHPDFLAKKDVIVGLAKKCPNVLKWANPSIKDDPETVLKILWYDSDALMSASLRLQECKDFKQAVDFLNILKNSPKEQQSILNMMDGLYEPYFYMVLKIVPRISTRFYYAALWIRAKESKKKEKECYIIKNQKDLFFISKDFLKEMSHYFKVAFSYQEGEVISLNLMNLQDKLLLKCLENPILFKDIFNENDLLFDLLIHGAYLRLDAFVDQLLSDEEKLLLQGTKNLPAWMEPSIQAQANVNLLLGHHNKVHSAWNTA